VLINDSIRRQIGIGEYFGDLALLYNAPRSASIKTLENSCFWAIDRHTFRNAMEELSEKNYSTNREFIEGIKLFRRQQKKKK
jgi:CRP-like cAMP-binding protein